MADWARIDVSILRNPKMARLSSPEQVGYLAMILYAQEHETDGYIHQSALRMCDVTPKHARRMTDAGLIGEVEDGWQIIGFLKYQPSKAEMEQRRDGARRAAITRWSKRAGHDREAAE